MKWLYCSECRWNDDGPNIYKDTRCPICGDLLSILEGTILEILEIYNILSWGDLSLLDYLERNVIRKVPKSDKYII